MSVRTNDLVVRWYNRAQIDYTHYYAALYTSFNAWYQQYTHIHNDREAINRLRKGIGLWRLYCQGVSLQRLRAPMSLVVELTQREPLPHSTPHWKGELESIYDWPSLLEYWYRVRCLVIHGSEIAPAYVYLAYETLNIVMGELVLTAPQQTREEYCLQHL